MRPQPGLFDSPAARYCIDTNVIVSFMHHDESEIYGSDVFAPQWRLIEAQIANGIILAPHSVRDELEGWIDQVPALRLWLLRHRYMFRELTDEHLVAAKRIVNHFPAYGRVPNYIADLEVISVAAADHIAALTLEKPTGHSPRRPKISGVCDELGIDCVSVTGYLRREANR